MINEDTAKTILTNVQTAIATRTIADTSWALHIINKVKDRPELLKIALEIIEKSKELNLLLEKRIYNTKYKDFCLNNCTGVNLKEDTEKIITKITKDYNWPCEFGKAEILKPIDREKNKINTPPKSGKLH